MSRSIFLLPFLLASPALLAQETAGRPRLGLVLSGGGARGMAHIGVLQVMEELPSSSSSGNAIAACCSRTTARPAC